MRINSCRQFLRSELTHSAAANVTRHPFPAGVHYVPGFLCLSVFLNFANLSPVHCSACSVQSVLKQSPIFLKSTEEICLGKHAWSRPPRRRLVIISSSFSRVHSTKWGTSRSQPAGRFSDGILRVFWRYNVLLQSSTMASWECFGHNMEKKCLGTQRYAVCGCFGGALWWGDPAIGVFVSFLAIWCA